MTEERRKMSYGSQGTGLVDWCLALYANPDPSYLPSISHSIRRWISSSGHREVGGGVDFTWDLGEGI